MMFSEFLLHFESAFGVVWANVGYLGLLFPYLGDHLSTSDCGLQRSAADVPDWVGALLSGESFGIFLEGDLIRLRLGFRPSAADYGKHAIKRD